MRSPVEEVPTGFILFIQSNGIHGVIDTILKLLINN